MIFLLEILHTQVEGENKHKHNTGQTGNMKKIYSGEFLFNELPNFYTNQFST